MGLGAAEAEMGGCEAHTALYSTIYQDLTPWLSRGFHKEDFDLCPDEVRPKLTAVSDLRSAMLPNCNSHVLFDDVGLNPLRDNRR